MSDNIPGKSSFTQKPAPSTRSLVVGSSGYIGRHVTSALVSARTDNPKNQVFGLDRNGNPNAQGWRSLEGDIMNAQLPMLLQEIQPDVIYLVIGADRLASLNEQLQVNVEGTRHLLQSIVESNLASRVVIVGSAAEYGNHSQPVDEQALPNPTSAYGIAKLAQTQVAQLYAKRYHVPVMIARLFNLYGQTPRHLVVASLAAQVAQAKNNNLTHPHIKVRHLGSQRDFIHIDDAVNGLLAVASNGCPGEIYNIASGQAYSIQHVLSTLIRLAGMDGVLTQANSAESDLGFADDFSQAVIDKMVTKVGWKPNISLDVGLKRELDGWIDILSRQAMARS